MTTALTFCTLMLLVPLDRAWKNYQLAMLDAEYVREMRESTH